MDKKADLEMIHMLNSQKISHAELNNVMSIVHDLHDKLNHVGVVQVELA